MNFLEKLNLANTELRNEFGKNTKILSRCKCCCSCTLSELHNKNIENYIAWEIFSYGVNKNIQEYKDGICNDAYGIWNLTDEQLTKAIEILSKYFEIEKPVNDSQTLHIKL